MSTAADRPARVALVHDWLTGMRGGEKVLEELCRLYPAATLFTLAHVRGSVSPLIEAMDVRTSWLERLPGSPRRFRAWLPLFPAAVESFDLRGYDLVVSSSHCVAKGVVPEPGAVHVAYLHTPMRYVWDLAPEYLGRMPRPARPLWPLVASWLRTWDAAASARVDSFIANSRHVARRIASYYHRRATVVHPPVDTGYFTPGDERRRHLLVVSALVPYKAIELALDAVRGLDLELKVVGAGPERRRLEARAPGNARFLGQVDGDELRRLYRGALAFLLPGEEDFGIAAVEAQACGTPVVAYARGGALETVTEGLTGTFFTEPSAASLRQAVDRVLNSSFDAARVRAEAERFEPGRFRLALERQIDAAWSAAADGRRR